MTTQTIAEQTIKSIKHGRTLIADFADNLDQMANTHDNLDPATMTIDDAKVVFKQTAELLRHYRTAMLEPMLKMMSDMETTCGLAGIIETARTGIMEAGEN